MLEIIKLNKKYLLVIINETEDGSIIKHSFDVVMEFKTKREVWDFLYSASVLYKDFDKEFDSHSDYECPKEI